MDKVETFATARMAATRISETDFDDVFRLNQDPEVAKTLGGTRSEAQTRAYLRSAIEHWECNGYGFWVFRDRQSGRFIGRAGLRHLIVGGGPELELSYALMPEFWRTGIATEMSRAILEIADRLGLTNIVAFTRPTNVASRGVMETVGFQYERDIIWADGPAVLYRRQI